MLKLKIIASQSALTLKNIPLELYGRLEGFLGSLLQPALRPNTNKFAKQPEQKLFAIAKCEPIGIKVHKNLIEKLRPLINRFSGSDITPLVESIGHYTPEVIPLVVQDPWKLRDYQIPVKAFLTDQETNPHLFSPLLVSLPTGYGKTSTALMSAADLNTRILVFLAPTMIPQWLENIHKILNVGKKDVLTISGSDSLRGLQQLAFDDNLTEKVIIISNKTYQNYISAYEDAEGDYESLGYLYPPETLLQSLKVGVVIVDEIHMSWHFNFKLMLYSTVKHFWALSASLISNDKFIEKTYHLAFPKETRYEQEVTEKYINFIAIAYYFESLTGIKYTVRNSTFYNQIEFENSIFKDSKRRANLLKMLKDALEIGYLGPGYQKGDRCALYFQSIEACTVVTAYLKHHFPQLTVARFVQKDPQSNLYDPDIKNPK